jgi:hypothetical protein
MLVRNLVAPKADTEQGPIRVDHGRLRGVSPAGANRPMPFWNRVFTQPQPKAVD